MNETLTELALDYGWGCPTCKGTGESEADDWDEGRTVVAAVRCTDCHGNRVTPSDAEDFERKVASIMRGNSVNTALLRRPARQSLDSLQRRA